MIEKKLHLEYLNHKYEQLKDDISLNAIKTFVDEQCFHLKEELIQEEREITSYFYIFTPFLICILFSAVCYFLKASCPLGFIVAFLFSLPLAEFLKRKMIKVNRNNSTLKYYF